MLKKLLKHDFRAIGRTWWIIAVVILSLAIGGSFSFYFIALEEQNEAFAPLATFSELLYAACILCIVGSVVGVFILIYVRFYNQLFTDEGYLTFTLPASRRDILLSKTLNAVIWTVAHALLIFICACIFDLVSCIPVEGQMNFNDTIFYGIGVLFKTLWQSIGAWTIVYVLEIIILAVIGLFFATCLIQLCITIAATVAKKAKLLAAIGIYYLAGIILSLLGQMIALTVTAMTAAGVDTVFASLTEGQGCAVIALALFIGIAMLLTFTLTLYFVNRNVLERKLNLA